MRMGFQPIRTGVSPDSEHIHAGVYQLKTSSGRRRGNRREDLE